jgi:HAD superfamily hydrolase (TIGR01484 family)
MKPLAALDADEARGLRGLLFDLDDTVLDHGLLGRPAFGALWDLADAGLRLVAVTGRPSGWGDVLVRQWPIAGAVTENGAVHVVKDGRGVSRQEGCSEVERLVRRERLARLVEAVRAEVPEARLTDDVDARRADVTWDIGERARLDVPTVDRIAAVIAAHGARSTRSSVHVHATFDGDDKASGAVRFVHRRFGDDVGAAIFRYAFVGDSTNDAPCFSAFRTTFGVANVAACVPRLTRPPRYVATLPMGAGFAEIAAALLRLRASP